jgi:hypothetical protein
MQYLRPPKNTGQVSRVLEPLRTASSERICGDAREVHNRDAGMPRADCNFMHIRSPCI